MSTSFIMSLCICVSVYIFVYAGDEIFRSRLLAITSQRYTGCLTQKVRCYTDRKIFGACLIIVNNYIHDVIINNTEKNNYKF